MSRKRVVITGVSAITPLGLDAAGSWEALLAGKSGLGPITHFDSTEFDTHIAGEVKNFNPEARIPAKQCRRMDRFTQFAVDGALQLLEDARLSIDEKNADRTGIMLGVGLGGLQTIENFHSKLLEAGPARVSPFYIPMLISNMAPGQVAIFTGARGTNVVMTSACASALHAIGYAYTEIVMGRADAVISGGMEATITPMGISGFTSMKALCTRFNDEPHKASRPFDKDRAGFVMGEGAGMLLLESLDSALARGARVYAEVIGFGASDDAYHIVAPLETGQGMAASMQRALADAGVRPGDVDHISAHGTSTPANDVGETRAIHAVFGSHAKNIAITAVKSQIGHLLGASGGVASLFAAKTLETGMVPGTINVETPDPECDLNYMADGPKKLHPRCALINSFGFGGTNASLLLRRYEA
ncbi:MAG: beta-ketoacyl-ACP synthase II [Desulfovibrionaceae bacterium]|nr:beta-ketoacyl-ACP synthase II [Desulfovibrionaceae bacterium]